MKTEKEKDKGKEKESSKARRRWTVSIVVCAFFLSVFMSLFSDVLLRHSNTLIAFVILIVIILIGILFDIVGVAVTVADPAPFHSMASNRVKGAKSSLIMIRNASRVSNVCNDVVGDTCGIISGTSAAYIVTQISAAGLVDFAVASVVLSGLVASMTIGGKAMGKELAIVNAKNIMTLIGKIISVVLER